MRLADCKVLIGTMKNVLKIMVGSLKGQIIWKTVSKIGDNIKINLI
jgi:hypothetical protein